MGLQRGRMMPAAKQRVPCCNLRSHHFVRNQQGPSGQYRYSHVGLKPPQNSDVCEYCGWQRQEIMADLAAKKGVGG